MANQWLRLWHDMPNDPKWRTISRIAKQPIPNVLSVYIHLLVNASNATERGRTQNISPDDIASALDLNCSDIVDILNAMEGRVLSGDKISGWHKRQVLREDNSAERAKAWREEKNRTQPNATERNRTQDKDKDTETKEKTKAKKKSFFFVTQFEKFWELYPRKVGRSKCAQKFMTLCQSKIDAEKIIAGLEKYLPIYKTKEPEFIPHPLTWLSQQRWNDEIKTEKKLPQPKFFSASEKPTQEPKPELKKGVSEVDDMFITRLEEEVRKRAIIVK